MDFFQSSRKWRQGLRAALIELTRLQPARGNWQLPLAAALATGIPLLLAASQDVLALGLPASLGGLALLYLPQAPVADRIVHLMACAFGLLAAYALGALGQQVPAFTIPVLMLCTAMASMGCSFYGVAPPGVLFFVMTASIAAYTPVHAMQGMANVGLFGMGCVLAVALGAAYSLQQHLATPVHQTAPRRDHDFDDIVSDAVVIALATGLSLTVATLLQLDRPYWVPVSCVAMFRATSLQNLWIRHLHRNLGTAVGVVFFWALANLQLGAWGMALVMIALTFCIESFVARHYGIAVALITPYALLMAEAAQLAQHSPYALMQARFIDTVVGATIGLVGAACLHMPRVRGAIVLWLRRLRTTTLRTP